MSFFYKDTKTPIFYYEPLTPAQLAAEKKRIQKAEDDFIRKWGNEPTAQQNVMAMNTGQPVTMVQTTNPLARALTNFALSLKETTKPKADGAITVIDPSGYLTPEVLAQVFAQPELTYISPIVPDKRPGDMLVQPAQHGLFLGARLRSEDLFIGGTPLSQFSTLAQYPTGKTATAKLFSPKHITEVREESHFNIKPLAALVSIVTAGMGGMLAAPAGAGVSAGAGAGALSASEAAGYGGISFGSELAANLATPSLNVFPSSMGAAMEGTETITPEAVEAGYMDAARTISTPPVTNPSEALIVDAGSFPTTNAAPEAAGLIEKAIKALGGITTVAGAAGKALGVFGSDPAPKLAQNVQSQNKSSTVVTPAINVTVDSPGATTGGTTSGGTIVSPGTNVGGNPGAIPGGAIPPLTGIPGFEGGIQPIIMQGGTIDYQPILIGAAVVLAMIFIGRKN